MHRASPSVSVSFSDTLQAVLGSAPTGEAPLARVLLLTSRRLKPGFRAASVAGLLSTPACLKPGPEKTDSACGEAANVLRQPDVCAKMHNPGAPGAKAGLSLAKSAHEAWSGLCGAGLRR